MGKAGKKKTTKQLFNEYEEKFGSQVGMDDMEMLVTSVSGEKFDKAFTKAHKFIQHYFDNAETYVIKLTLYQKVMKYHMPRSKGKFKGFYTPYIADFHKLVEEMTEEFRSHYKQIGSPAQSHCIAYYPIPKSMKLPSVILSIIGFNRPITTPDTDNVIKFYDDTIKSNILYDDDLIYKSISEKRYSFTPRVELTLKIRDIFSSPFAYDSFMKRESVKNAIESGILNIEILDKNKVEL